MRLLMKRGSTSATVLLGALLLVPPPALIQTASATTAEDCENIYRAGADQCGAEWGDRDFISYSAYLAAYNAARYDYDTKIQQNAADYAASLQDPCQANLYLAIGGDPLNPDNPGTCATKLTADLAAALVVYNQEAARCNALYPPPDDAGYNSCMCKPIAQYAFKQADVTDLSEGCKSDAQSTYNNCSDGYKAGQTSKDTGELVRFNYKAQTANAELQQKYTKSTYTASLCAYAKCCALGICLFGVDCSLHPANCCADSCQITDLSAYLAAYTDYVNKVGDADSARVYELAMCAARHNKWDLVAYRNETFTVDNALANFNYLNREAWSTYTRTFNMAEFQLTEDKADCLCDHPSNPDYTDCVNLATADAQDAQVAAYGDYVGTFYELDEAYGEIYSTALNALPNAYAANAQTDTVCQQYYQNAFNGIYQQACIDYNIAIATAEDALVTCLQGCISNG